MFTVDPKVILFLQVILVVGLPMMLWGPLRLGAFFPLPIIQIFAGIMLGPSVFGALAPGAYEFFFRSEVLSGVDTLANVALVLFVFLAGCELDRGMLRRSAGMVLQTGVSGVGLTWTAGTLAAWGLLTFFPAAGLASTGLIGRLDNPLLFCVSFGLCMAVTALPILVVILRELGFNQTPIGTIALAVGAVDDALLWSALSVILPFAAGSSSPLAAFAVAVTGGLVTVLLLTFVITPVLERLIKHEAQERFLISCAILALFFAAALNEATHLHAAIGAFLAGLLLPDKIRHMAQDRLDTPVTLLLLPFLFLATGLKTNFNFTDPTVWVVALLALLVCIGAKFTSVFVSALLHKESVPFATTLGILMQCKGLMEIVVVTVLYQRGVIGQATFSALVLVALITTAMTVPLARLSKRIFGDRATQNRGRELPPVDVVATAAPKPDVQWPDLAPAGAGSAGFRPKLASALPTLPTLVFEAGLGRVPLTKGEMLIGRHSNDDIRINDVRVSRQHARLVATNGRYEIHNLTAVRSEPNPMLINGTPKEHAILADGDVVSLGGVKFTFRAAA